MRIVVGDISLDRSTDPPVASGGDLAIYHPWRPDEDRLTPLCFSYWVPEQLAVPRD